jgi:hypothetical protein
MRTSKPALASTGLRIILALAVCISIGVLIGFHGGLHNEAGAIYDSGVGKHAVAGKEEIRLYGAFVLLCILGLVALVTLALFVGGIFPPRRKRRHSVSQSKAN